MRFLVTIALALAVLLQTPGPEVPAKQDPATIRVDVRLRQIVATVRDETSGMIVKKLRPADFIVEENGAPQTVSLFSDDAEEPISLGILIDSSGSMSAMPGGTLSGLTAAVGITRILLRQMKPDDEIAVLSFSNRLRVDQPFTKNRSQIESALGSLRAEGGVSVLQAIGPALGELTKARHRKRALIVMTDAFFGGDPTLVQREVSGAEAPIFAFAMRGADFGLEHPPGHACTGACHQFETLPATARGGAPAAGLRNLTQPLLKVLADASGGRSMIFEMHPRNTIPRIMAAIEDIAAELRGQYVLGYYPTGAGAGAVRVRMASPGYRVHIRRDDTR